MAEVMINESCIDLWKAQLEDATNQLSIKSAEFNKQKAAYSDLCKWVIQLQSFLENMDETDEKRAIVVSTLDLFIDQAETVCKNIACLKEGIEILYCDIIQTSTCVEDLYCKVIDLVHDIDKLNNANLSAENSIIVKCLSDLQIQIEKVLGFYQDMINQILDTATTVYRIECFLCNTELGLLKKLTDLLAYFGGDVNEEYCGTHRQPGGGAAPTDSKVLCMETLDSPGFPLSDGDFYKDIKVTLSKAELSKEACKEDLDDLTKEKVKLEACTASLGKAIDEASKAQASK